MELNTDMSKPMFMTVTSIIAILSLLVFSNAFAITDTSTTPKTDKDNKDKDNKPAADEDEKNTMDNAPHHRDDQERSDSSSEKKDKTPFVLAEPVPFP
jgi:cytoskeletal protein RodZ